jgi:hypothetical protein
MKSILLLLCTAVVIQMSTCGNQGLSSDSKYGRGYSLMDKLFKEYVDKHDDVESLVDKFNDLNQDEHRVLSEWKDYNQFAKTYWSEVNHFIGNFDSTTQNNLSAFFKSQEKAFDKSTKAYANKAKDINTEWTSLDQQMKMLKLLASHEALTKHLKDDKPNLSAMESYNQLIVDLGTEMGKTNQGLIPDPSIAKTLK